MNSSHRFLQASGSRALSGFLVSGFLFAILGALLPAWGHHLSERDSAAGAYFLCSALGIIVATQVFRRFAAPRDQSRSLAAACFFACAALVGLSFAAPPEPAVWRFAGSFAIGFSTGLLNSGLFAAIERTYRQDPASTLMRGGIYFGGGCLLSAVLVAGTFYLSPVGVPLLLGALVPGAFGLMFRYGSSASEPSGWEQPIGTFSRDFLSARAVLFTLLLFFQSGNEWTMAGWLPIFLIRRLGVSPRSAVWMLAVYWSALLGSRLAAVYLASILRHGRLLFGSASAALAGCLLLVLTDNKLGAMTGILLAGGGFAAVFPLVSEMVGRRFPSYNPGLFNSIFSVAIAGGLLEPWIAGLFSDWLGLWVVMGLPAIGTLLVVVLLLLLWLESKVTGR